MITNPLKKEKSFGEKMGQALHLPHKPSKSEKVLMVVQKYGIYLALFLAGYLVSMIQNLMSI